MEETIETYVTKSFKHEGVSGSQSPSRLKEPISPIVNLPNSAVDVPKEKTVEFGVELVQHNPVVEKSANVSISGDNVSVENLPKGTKSAGYSGQATQTHS